MISPLETVAIIEEIFQFEVIGEEIEVEGLTGKFKIKVVGDEAVDPEFGTGVVKVTPSHDFKDFEIADRKKLLRMFPKHKTIIEKLTLKSGAY